MDAEITRSRLKLCCDIDKWCKSQVGHFLALQSLISEAQHVDPEVEPLFLPSHFPTVSQRQKLGLYDLGFVICRISFKDVMTKYNYIMSLFVLCLSIHEVYAYD